jgi:hypothetical protein
MAAVIAFLMACKGRNPSSEPDEKDRSELVEHIGFVRDPGYYYFLRNGEVQRILKQGRKAANQPVEKIAETHFQRDPAFFYFVDAIGDVRRMRKAPGANPYNTAVPSDDQPPQ